MRPLYILGLAAISLGLGAADTARRVENVA
jgi:hypothetical protein